MKKDDDLVVEILQFWFSDEVKPMWFKATSDFDELLRKRYGKIWGLARAGQYDHWGQEPESALALVIVLDQLPLNMFREDARQYSTEAHARKISQHVINQGLDQKLTQPQKAFLYLPFMHSESLEDQDFSVELYDKNDLKENLRFAKHHRDVVKRFGRFPHRNKVLARDSTDEEIEYLKTSNW